VTTVAPPLSFDSFQVRNLPADEWAMAEELVLSGDWDAALEELTEDEARSIEWDWAFWGRPDQFEPDEFARGDRKVWFVRAGRGYGKTRTGAETVRSRVHRGMAGRLAIVAPTAGDARDIMVEGESGILACHPPWFQPKYEPSKRRITWPNGATATVFSADEPDRLRGPQFDFVWGDEPASWRFGEEAWDNIEFGLRLGDHPQAMLTGTPRPLPWLKAIWADPETIVTTGSSFRNMANLAQSFIRRILKKYEGTRLGLQELHALVLEDVEGALWTRRMIDQDRIRWEESEGGLILPVPDLDVVVVGVDPAGTNTADSDETGIIVAGRDGTREDGHGYVLADWTLKGSPLEWAQAVVNAVEYHQADYVVAEVNMGWDLVVSNIHTVAPRLKVKKVSAKRGKKLRAQPVANLYEQHRIHHVGMIDSQQVLHGTKEAVLDQEGLETQMTEWVPGGEDGKPASGDSPDRVDALVYALSDLLVVEGKKKVRILA
jgi:phage terminase large subunit-like protein